MSGLRPMNYADAGLRPAFRKPLSIFCRLTNKKLFKIEHDLPKQKNSLILRMEF